MKTLLDNFRDLVSREKEKPSDKESDKRYWSTLENHLNNSSLGVEFLELVNAAHEAEIDIYVVNNQIRFGRKNTGPEKARRVVAILYPTKSNLSIQWENEYRKHHGKHTYISHATGVFKNFDKTPLIIPLEGREAHWPWDYKAEISIASATGGLMK